MALNLLNEMEIIPANIFHMRDLPRVTCLKFCLAGFYSKCVMKNIGNAACTTNIFKSYLRSLRSQEGKKLN